MYTTANVAIGGRLFYASITYFLQNAKFLPQGRLVPTPAGRHYVCFQMGIASLSSRLLAFTFEHGNSDSRTWTAREPGLRHSYGRARHGRRYTPRSTVHRLGQIRR